MLLRSFIIIILTPFLLNVGEPLASETPELEVLQKRLLLLEKEILDLKMKNIVEDKFEWQFLKMTEIENDIKELKNLKALILNSDTSNIEKTEDYNENTQKERVTEPSLDNSASLESLEVLGKEEEFYMSALTLFDRGQTKLAEQRLSEFIERFPTSTKLHAVLFWRAEARVKDENWIGAANDYLESFTINPDGESAPKTLFGLGVSLGAIGEKEQACLTLDEVGSRFENIERSLLVEIVKAKNLLNCDQPR